MYHLSLVTLLGSCIVSTTWATTIPPIITTNFDKIPSNPLLAQGNPIPVPTDGLAFNNQNARANGVSILRASSPNNTAASAPVGRLLNGSPPANISSIYKDSKVKYFSLISTRPGCAVNTQASLGVPQACKLRFTGTTTQGKQVSKVCDYGGTITNPTLAYCSFGLDFAAVTTVVVTVDSSLTVPDATVQYQDDVQHRNYY